MNTFPEHPFVEGDRVVHVETGRHATFTGTRREVDGVNFDFFLFDDGKTCFFYPSEVKVEFKKL